MSKETRERITFIRVFLVLDPVVERVRPSSINAVDTVSPKAGSSSKDWLPSPPPKSRKLTLEGSFDQVVSDLRALNLIE